jgi:heat shock protein HtpX
MARDRRLRLRMALTLAAVLAVDAVFAVVVASLLYPWLSALQGALAAAGLALPQPLWWTLVVGTGLALVAWAHYGYARSQLLAAVDAAPADAESHPDVHGRLTRLAATIDLEPPDLAVADTDVPNSLAVGRPGDATVVVSEGLLDRLDDDQLDSVLAHELSHVSNRDAAVMTLASFLPAMAADQYNPLTGKRPAAVGAALVALHAVGAMLLGPVGGLASVAGAALLVLFTLLFGGVALGLLAAPVLMLARRLSRDREFVADAAAARISGAPAALATALQELAGEDHDPPDEDVRATPDGVRGMCLLPYGFDGERDDWAATRSHPPVEDRVARLREFVGETKERVKETVPGL